jgi:hypothetical protein
MRVHIQKDLVLQRRILVNQLLFQRYRFARILAGMTQEDA